MSVIFISHRNNAHDNAFAAKVQAWLQLQKGIDGFLDFDIRYGLQAGDDWEARIYAEMNRAHVMIALISPEWLASDWCMSEARMARLRGILFIPCLVEPCRLPFPGIQTIDFVADEDRAFAQLRQRLTHTFTLPAHPYPGLAAFTHDDAGVFFGRDEEIRDLHNELDALYRGRPEAPRLLVVLGASGSGKSSLVRAGLLPRLEGASDILAVDPFIPGEQPLSELRRALRQTAYRRGQRLDPPALCARATPPHEQADTVISFLEQIDPLPQHALIVVDQAEELLRSPCDGVLSLLSAVLDRGAGRIVVLATMRSGFLQELQTSALITTEPALRYRTFPVDPLPAAKLGEVVREPAKRFGTEVEEALVDRLKAESGGPDSLPLLAFFLREFWQPAFIRDGRLTLADYEAFGGFRKALDKAIDRALAQCRERVAARASDQPLDERLCDLFVPNLVGVREVDGAPVRRRCETAGLTTEQTDLLDVFVHERLMIKGDGYVEVAHEALLRQWPDLARWIERDREQLLWLQIANSSAQAWNAASRAPDYLVHAGDRLASAQFLSQTPRFARLLTSQAVSYLSACADVEDHRRESVRLAFMTESRYLTDKAHGAFQKGDYASAIAYAVKALPRDDDATGRPYFAPAEHLLWRALFEPSVTAISPEKVDALTVDPRTNRLVTLTHGVITAFEATGRDSFAAITSCACDATAIVGFLQDGRLVYRRSDPSFQALTADLRRIETPFHAPSRRVVFDAVAPDLSRLVVVCTDGPDDWPSAYTVGADGAESPLLTIRSADSGETDCGDAGERMQFKTHARYAISRNGGMLVVDDGHRHLCLYDLDSSIRIGTCEIPGWQRHLCGTRVFTRRSEMIVATKGLLGLRLFTNYKSAISLLRLDAAFEEVHEIDGELRDMALNNAETLLLCLVDGDKIVVVDLTSKAAVYRRTLEREASRCGFLEDDRFIFVATPLTVFRRDDELYIKELSSEDLVIAHAVPVRTRDGEAIVFATSASSHNAGLFSWTIHRRDEGAPDIRSGKYIDRIVANADTSMLACVSRQGEVQLVELQDEPVVHRLALPERGVVDVGFNKTSTRVLVVGDADSVICVDVSTRVTEDGGVLTKRKADSDDLLAKELAEGGELFLLANMLVVRSDATGQSRQVSDHGGHSICSRRGLLFIADDRRAKRLGSVWDFEGGRKLYDIGKGAIFDLMESVFSPDGRYLAVGCVEYDPQDGIWDAEIDIFDMDSGALIDKQPLSKVSTEIGVTFSHDSAHWACILNRFNDPRSDSKIVIKETGRDRVASEIVLANMSVARVRFLPNARFLLAHDFDSKAVSVLDVASGDRVLDLPARGFRPDDVFLSVSGNYAICVDTTARVERFRLFRSTSEVIASAMHAMPYRSHLL